MFASRMRTTSAATQSGITRLRWATPQPASLSTFPPGSTTFRIAIGFAYMPPAASVEYAEARSIGVTTREPRPIDGTYAPSLLRRSVRTPRRCAIAAMFSGPTSRERRAKTELSERSVALSIDVGPTYEWSYVSGHQAVGGSVSHEPVSVGSYLKGAERYVV